jgi:hypothetical protein
LSCLAAVGFNGIMTATMMNVPSGQQQDGKARWLQGWINVDKLLQAK